MNRIFGRGNPKAPPPNLTDCISGVCVCFYVTLENVKQKNVVLRAEMASVLLKSLTELCFFILSA